MSYTDFLLKQDNHIAERFNYFSERVVGSSWKTFTNYFYVFEVILD